MIASGRLIQGQHGETVVEAIPLHSFATSSFRSIWSFNICSYQLRLSANRVYRVYLGGSPVKFVVVASNGDSRATPETVGSRRRSGPRRRSHTTPLAPAVHGDGICTNGSRTAPRPCPSLAAAGARLARRGVDSGRRLAVSRSGAGIAPGGIFSIPRHPQPRIGPAASADIVSAYAARDVSAA